MPLYEYECRKCGTRREVMQKLSDKPLTKCRECGGRLEKLLSAPAIQFKGSGWYVTDYAGKKSEEKKSDGPEEKSATAEATSSEEKATPKEKSSSKKSSTPKTTRPGKD